MPVAIVTDSTASLPASLVEERGIVVVPLRVVIGDEVLEEGPDGATAEFVVNALQDKKRITTSRPNPDEMLAVYEKLAAEGYDEIVSIHLSSSLSGTYDSARLAARRASVKVTAVDTRQVGHGTALAVLAAADARDAGADLRAIARAARASGRKTRSLFYVDTLEYLRRGGRVSGVGAFVGSALAVKPILGLHDGQVVSLEKVRTSGKALARLAELAVEAAGTDPVEIGISHLANPERAAALAETLSEQLAEQLDGRPILTGEVSAVLGAHAGTGMVAVSVARR